MFKSLYILLVSVGLANGQAFTHNDLPWLTSSASSAWNGTPEGIGNMAYHWIYTNIVAGAGGEATNWVDLIQSAPMNWNQLGSSTKILNTTTGVLFTALNGTRDALTNNVSAGLVTGNGLGTNFSVYLVLRQINNNFGANVMPVFGGFNDSGTSFANSGAGTDLLMSYNGNNATVVKSANQMPVDVFMTWSNAVFWAWTNGIACVTAQSWDNHAQPWNIGLAFGCKNNVSFNPWHGTLAEVGIYTNLPFTTATQIPSQLASVSNLHWYITNVPVLKTNGTGGNCIHP